jgi:hypothetical protein
MKRQTRHSGPVDIFIEATPGGRDSGAPFWSHENVIERGKHGVPGPSDLSISI